MKPKNAVDSVILACLAGLSQLVGLRADAQTLTINSNLTKSNFFVPSQPNQPFGGAGYSPFGGGSGAIDIFTINTTPFTGRTLASLFISLNLAEAVPLGQSGMVSFGHFTNPNYNGSSTYNSYVVGNTFIPDGTFQAVTEATPLGSGVKLTLSGFELVGNRALLLGTSLDIVFSADDPVFVAMMGADGNIGTTDNGVLRPTITGTVIVPEPSAWAIMLCAGAMLVFCENRQRQLTRTRA